MQPFGCNRYGPKIGWGLCPFGGGELGAHLTQCGRREAYLHAKFYLDPSNSLATLHERNGQDRQDRDRQDRQTDNGPIAEGEPVRNGRPKSGYKQKFFQLFKQTLP